jgi:hypothetical protein
MAVGAGDLGADVGADAGFATPLLAATPTGYQNLFRLA